MPKQVLSVIRYNWVSIKKYIFSFILFLLCIYPVRYVRADAVYRTGVDDGIPIATELSDGKIVSIYYNSIEEFDELGYWFNAAIYDPDKDEVCTYSLESQVDSIFSSDNSIWVNFIKVYPGDNNTFLLCIPVREGYYLELYDENCNHIDGEGILMGSTLMDGDAWNSDIHKIVFGKNGQIFANLMITKNIVADGNTTTGDYQGYQCYRIDYDKEIQVTHMEVPDRLYYNNYIPLYDGSVLAVGYNINKCYRSYGESYESVAISDQLHNIFNNTLGNIGIRNPVIFNSDSTEIFFLWDGSLQSITFNSDMEFVERRYVVDQINSQWDIGEIQSFDISQNGYEYEFQCIYSLANGSSPTHSMCGLLNDYGDITEYYECCEAYGGCGIAFRRTYEDYIAVGNASFRKVIPKKPEVHEWDDGIISKAPATDKAGEYTYTCRVCGETKTVTIPIPFPEENSLWYAKIDVEEGEWVDTGENVSDYIHVMLNGKKLKQGVDYTFRVLNYSPGNDIMVYGIDALGDYYCGITDAITYSIAAPHIHKWDEGHVYDDESKVTEIYTCTECGKLDYQIIKEYIKLSEAVINYYYDGCEPVYCGEEIRPIMDVYYNGSSLLCGRDFEVTYSDNINAGKATAKITGLGDCVGERIIEYYIDKADTPPGISSLSMTVEKQIEYVKDIELPKGWEFLDPEQRLFVGVNNDIIIEYNADDKDNYKNLRLGLEVVRADNFEKIDEVTGNESATKVKYEEEFKTEKVPEAKKDEEPKTEKAKEVETSEDIKTEKTTEAETKEEIKTDKPTEKETESRDDTSEKEIIYKNNIYRLTGKRAIFVKPGNSNVKSLTIPNKIKIKSKKYLVSAIDENACYGMKKLQNVTVGDSVITVGKNAFANCTKFKKITFGNKLIKLGDRVLAGDRGLKKITFKSSNIKSFGKKTFDGVPRKVDIIIPTAKMKKYIRLIKKAK